jgi:CHASE3 domain sensor protein
MQNIETKVAVLEQKVEQTTLLLNKLDTAIEKIGELSNSITKMLAVHEERLTKNDHTNEELYQLVEERREELSESVKELNQKISESSKEQTAALSETENRIMAAIQGLKNTVTTENKSVIDKALEMEKRISSLEKWRWILIGGGIVVGVIVRTAIPFILALVK